MEAKKGQKNGAKKESEKRSGKRDRKMRPKKGWKNQQEVLSGLHLTASTRDKKRMQKRMRKNSPP